MPGTLTHHFVQHFDQRFTLNYHKGLFKYYVINFGAFPDGRRINDDETPKALEMEQEDVIEVYQDTESMDSTPSLRPGTRLIPGAFTQEPTAEGLSPGARRQTRKPQGGSSKGWGIVSGEIVIILR